MEQQRQTLQGLSGQFQGDRTIEQEEAMEVQPIEQAEETLGQQTKEIDEPTIEVDEQTDSDIDADTDDSSSSYTTISTSSDEDQPTGRHRTERRRRQDEKACYDMLRSLFPGGQELSKMALMEVASKQIDEYHERIRVADAKIKDMHEQYGDILAFERAKVARQRKQKSSGARGKPGNCSSSSKGYGNRNMQQSPPKQ